ncbi:AAA family ATPase [Paenibacillus sp. MBLB4367]|uniref:AAA family ATPase n=1 Tax=Paenibacillus sp. MBLB4367 TaxID=3384767 RepID=UPI003908208F
MPPGSSNIRFEQPQDVIERVIANVERVMIGKREAIEQAVIALLCGGHLLLEDVPGVGKTMLVRALARTVDCGFKRIQFTPDLLPSDVTGVAVYNRRSGEFEFRQGPLFANVVLADELNRTSPKTQAALLEAMEEKHVTVDGTTYRLPEPFMLLATQNPLDYEGTFGLPEAQLDRFLLRIRIGYPEPVQEAAMLGRLQERHPIEQLRPVVLADELLDLQRQVRHTHVDESLRHYIVQLTTATRGHKEVELGASPRASLALMLAAQAKAVVGGRSFVVPDDIKAMAVAALSHRLVLTGDARMTGKNGEQIVRQIVAQQPVPALRNASNG